MTFQWPQWWYYNCHIIIIFSLIIEKCAAVLFIILSCWWWVLMFSLIDWLLSLHTLFLVIVYVTMALFWLGILPLTQHPIGLSIEWSAVETVEYVDLVGKRRFSNLSYLIRLRWRKGGQEAIAGWFVKYALWVVQRWFQPLDDAHLILEWSSTSMYLSSLKVV